MAIPKAALMGTRRHVGELDTTFARVDVLLREAAIRPQLVAHFQPALLARFQTVVYRPLSSEALARIVKMKLDKVARRINAKFGVPLICDDALIEELVRACRLPDSGARNIDSLLDQQILPVLSRELLVRVAAEQGLHAIRLSYSDADGISVDFDAAIG